MLYVEIESLSIIGLDRSCTAKFRKYNMLKIDKNIGKECMFSSLVLFCFIYNLIIVPTLVYLFKKPSIKLSEDFFGV